MHSILKKVTNGKVFAMRKNLPGSPTKNRMSLGLRASINPGNKSAIVQIVRRPAYKQKENTILRKMQKQAWTLKIVFT